MQHLCDGSLGGVGESLESNRRIEFDAGKKEKQMSRAIITAKVENSAAWENGFRSHAELFNDYTATAIYFTATDENEVAILWEVTDMDRFLELLDAPETAEAMAYDGVNRESVKVYVLDKEIDL